MWDCFGAGRDVFAKVLGFGFSNVCLGRLVWRDRECRVRRNRSMRTEYGCGEDGGASMSAPWRVWEQ